MPMLETSWQLNKRRRIRTCKMSWLVDAPAETRLLSKSASKSKASCKSVSKRLLRILVTIRPRRVT